MNINIHGHCSDGQTCIEGEVKHTSDSTTSESTVCGKNLQKITVKKELSKSMIDGRMD